MVGLNTFSMSKLRVKHDRTLPDSVLRSIVQSLPLRVARSAGIERVCKFWASWMRDAMWEKNKDDTIRWGRKLLKGAQIQGLIIGLKHGQG